MAIWTLPVLSAAFWAGIVVEGIGTPGPGREASALLLCGAAASALALIAPGARAFLGRLGVWVVLVVSFWLMGVGWAGLRDARVRASPLALLAGRPLTVIGSLQDVPKAGQFGWTAPVRTDLVLVRDSGGSGGGAFRTGDPLWVQGHGPPPKLRTGDRVIVEGISAIPRGEFGLYLRHRGFPATMAADRVTYRGPPSSPLQRVATSLRGWLTGSLRRALPAREAGLVMGLAIGDTSRLDPRVEESFRATGLSHLTAVSGENLAMFLAPVLGLAMLLGAGRRTRLATGVVAVAFFVVLTGAEPSVLRAAAMSGLCLIGVFMGRPRSTPAILGGAVLALLAMNPTLVYSIGFQLSVAATAGMTLLAGPLSERLGFLPRGLALAAGTTLGAQAGVTPLLLYHFGVVPTVSVPANLLAFPAVGPAMLLGLLAGVVGGLFAAGGVVIGLAGRVPLAYLEWLARRLARSPLPSITSSGGQLSHLAMGVLVVLAFAWWIRSGRRLPRRGLLAVAVAVPLFLWSGAVRAGGPEWPTATFFDVGWGDGALVRSPGGATIVIDGGSDPELMAGKLASLGVRRVDLMVATHPHADHLGGLPSVLSRFAVGLVIDPGCRADSPVYAQFLDAVRGAGVPFRHPRPGWGLVIGDVRLRVLGPAHCFAGTRSDPNNDSVVVRVDIQQASMLFTGDVEEPAQTDLLRDHADDLRVTVLKVPHHGGDTNLPGFFDGMGSRLAVVSVGPNRYGHPVASVLQALAAEGMRVYRTDRSGDVVVTFRGGEVLVSGR